MVRKEVLQEALDLFNLQNICVYLLVKYASRQPAFSQKTSFKPGPNPATAVVISLHEHFRDCFETHSVRMRR